VKLISGSLWRVELSPNTFFRARLNSRRGHVINVRVTAFFRRPVSRVNGDETRDVLSLNATLVFGRKRTLPHYALYWHVVRCGGGRDGHFNLYRCTIRPDVIRRSIVINMMLTHTHTHTKRAQRDRRIYTLGVYYCYGWKLKFCAPKRPIPQRLNGY